MAETTVKTNQSALVWTIYDTAKTKRLTGAFKDALKKASLDRVIGLLSDACLLRSLVVRRGDGGENLKLIEQAFQLWLGRRLKKVINLREVNINQLLQLLRKDGIPEQVLNELAHVHFHFRNETNFLDITSLIIDNAAVLHNKAVIARARHDLGSWHNVNGNYEAAITENKIALALARDIGEPVIEAKAKFGLSHSKGYLSAGGSGKKTLKPRLMLDDFMSLAVQLERLGVFYDAIRARIEAARALIALARRKEKQEKKDLLLTAKNLTLAALYAAKDHEYPNAEVLARENLSVIYAEVKESRKEKSYFKGAIDLRDKYKYLGKSLILN